jgi:hypothetical protein
LFSQNSVRIFMCVVYMSYIYKGGVANISHIFIKSLEILYIPPPRFYIYHPPTQKTTGMHIYINTVPPYIYQKYKGHFIQIKL